MHGGESLAQRALEVQQRGGSRAVDLEAGLVLGGLIQGIDVKNGAFAGGTFDFATPFALLCGLGLVAGYALLGATWLVMKTEGPVAEHSRRQAKLLLLVVLAFLAIVSVWTPLAFERIAARWFSLPNFYVLWPVPAVTALTALTAWRALNAKDEKVIPARRSSPIDTTVSNVICRFKKAIKTHLL